MATALTSRLDPAVVGRNIRLLRTLRGLTLEQLGDSIGLNPSGVSRFECGLRVPRRRLLALIAKKLGVSENELTKTIQLLPVVTTGASDGDLR